MNSKGRGVDMNKLNMTILKELYGVCRLKRDAVVPMWTENGEFVSVTRTLDELSIVCPEENIPKEITCEQNWRVLKIEGPLEFSMVGVLARISMILANAKISLFVISTFDTDYILVKDQVLEETLVQLRREGYQIK